MRAQAAWWGSLLTALILQSSVLPFFLPDGFTPDLTRGLVLWLALTGTPGYGVFLAFAAGFAVDLFAGAPLGLTALMRLVLYGFARPGRGILEMPFAVFVAGPLAVLSDTVVILLLQKVLFVNEVSLGVLIATALKQALVELASVPLIFIIMELATGYRADEAPV
ncbi:MAG: rod shape-determining protein MreD [Deltaproteobacteria bacterium]|nr:MAG: rod shape-determining protein MreD [Deltaproteobacteria bacterium]